MPRVLLFDVNGTLSDLAPVAQCFAAAGTSADLAAAWFSALLRDGFALTATGANPSFAQLAAETLHSDLEGRVEDVEAKVEQIMSVFAELPVHPDVVEGIRTLHTLDLGLATLSNGSRAIAQGLLDRSGLTECFDRLLSVEDAPTWKPAQSAYEYGLRACGCATAEAMLVAVHPWDIHGAHHAGLATAWINRTDASYPAYFAPPDLEATSLVDLAAQLGAVAA